MRLEHGSQWLEFTVLGATGDGVSSGSTETYTMPSYKIAFSAAQDLLKENIVLNDVSAPRAFHYHVATSPDLHAVQDANGSIEFLDPLNQPVFAFQAPFMYDSSTPAPALSPAVSMTLSPSPSGEDVAIAADPGWLADSRRRWPVTIDPTADVILAKTFGDDIGCPMVAQYPTFSYCTMPYLWAGYFNGAYRSLLHFNVGAAIPSDAVIESSFVGVYVQTTQYSTQPSTTVNLDQVTRGGWTMSASWAKYDGTNYWTIPGGDFIASPISSNTIPSGTGGFYIWDATPLVQSWTDGAAPNDGVELVAANEGVTNLIQFYSSQAGAPAADWPYLDVFYTFRKGAQAYYPMLSWQLNDRMDVNVNVSNGNLLLHESDLSMDGIGMPLQVDRYFNSITASIGTDGEFGNGWNLGSGSDVNLENWVFSVVFFEPDGTAVPFATNGEGTFTSPPGIDATLVQNGDNTYTLTDHATQEALHFDSNGTLLSDTDRSGNSLTYSYELINNQQVTYQITDTQGRQTTFYYGGPPAGPEVVTSIVDPARRTFRYGYDSSFTHLTSYSDPSSGTTGFIYDAGGNLIQVNDPDGNQTRFTYVKDSFGIERVTSLKRVTNNSTGAGYTTSFAYSAGKTVVTDSNRHATTYSYDAYGRQLSVTDPLNHTSRTTWTADDQVYQDIAPSGATTTMQYDANNDLTSETLPTGPSFSWAYNNPSWPYQPSSSTDEEGRTTTYQYNAQGLLTAETDPSNHAWNSVYNQNGTIYSDTSPNGNTTYYSYNVSPGTNGYGLLQQVTNPSPLGAESLTYDTYNRVYTESDGKGQQTTYGYDYLDRLAGAEHFYSGGGESGFESYWYDANGNVIRQSDEQAGQTTYQYNALGQQVNKTLPSGAHLADGHSVDYTYDGEDNLLSKTDSGGRVGYTYNVDDSTASITDPLSATTRLFYDQNGNETLALYPVGVDESITYDASNQLTKVAGLGCTGGVGPCPSFSYSYTNPFSYAPTTTRYSVTDAAGNTTSFAYDSLVRLTQATQKNGSGVQIAGYSYGYDPNGNMTYENVNGLATNMVFNAADELTQETGGTNASLTYDANGNQMSSAALTSLAYNPKDQTTGILPSGGAMQSMTYTGAGQTERISRTADTLRYDQTGLSAQTDSVTGKTTYFTRGPGGQLISERIPLGETGCSSSSNGYCTYYYLYDGVGSVAAVVNSSKAVQDQYAYDPYGNTVGATQELVPNPFRFASAIWDSATGLYKVGERYYDPVAARFSQLDPAGGAYAYAGDNPINLVDPSGTDLEAPVEFGGGPIDDPLGNEGWAPSGSSPGHKPVYHHRGGASGGGGHLDYGRYLPDEKVNDILKTKEGRIKNAPLKKGSPSWEDIRYEKWGEIVRKARRGVVGYGTFKKLLTDREYDK
ncbi:MAG: RHS repeat domain-containing protein [Chloroflexota bacterium]